MGRGKTTRRWKKTHTSPHFHPVMRSSQGGGDSGDRNHARTPIRGRNPGAVRVVASLTSWYTGMNECYGRLSSSEDDIGLAQPLQSRERLQYYE